MQLRIFQKANLPPIRNKVDISAVVKGKTVEGNSKDIFTDKDVGGDDTEEKKKLKRDVTPMPDYYKNWDKFNVDEALKSDDEEDIEKDKRQQLEEYLKKK